MLFFLHGSDSWPQQYKQILSFYDVFLNLMDLFYSKICEEPTTMLKVGSRARLATWLTSMCHIRRTTDWFFFLVLSVNPGRNCLRLTTGGRDDTRQHQKTVAVFNENSEEGKMPDPCLFCLAWNVHISNEASAGGSTVSSKPIGKNPPFQMGNVVTKP